MARSLPIQVIEADQLDANQRCTAVADSMKDFSTLIYGQDSQGRNLRTQSVQLADSRW
mgnify:CR=1 FL=1